MRRFLEFVRNWWAAVIFGIVWIWSAYTVVDGDEKICVEGHLYVNKGTYWLEDTNYRCLPDIKGRK